MASIFDEEEEININKYKAARERYKAKRRIFLFCEAAK